MWLGQNRVTVCVLFLAKPVGVTLFVFFVVVVAKLVGVTICGLEQSL